jgi:hypothetical protein
MHRGETAMLWQIVNRSKSTFAAMISIAVGIHCACSNAQFKSTSKQPPAQAIISICDLFKDLTRYRGELVTVRGIYWHGLRQPCPDSFVTLDHKWPSALNLVDSDLVATQGQNVPFKTDRKSWDVLDEITLREIREGRHEEIWVTAVGKLRTPEGYIRDDGRVAGGYGHLGVFPAELVVQRVFDIEIKATPTYDYGLMRAPGER